MTMVSMMTLDEIIKKYSGKKIKIIAKDNISATGKICGYETKTESDVGEDVIFIDISETTFYEIKVPDIISIEDIQ